MTPDYKCIHEEQIQNHTLQINELESKAGFKEQRIDELNIKIEKMDGKIDELLEGFNEFKMKSSDDDKNLEIRLKAIETELELQKQNFKTWLTVVSIALTALTVYLNFMV